MTPAKTFGSIRSFRYLINRWFSYYYYYHYYYYYCYCYFHYYCYYHYYYYIISKEDNFSLRGSIDAYTKHELNHDYTKHEFYLALGIFLLNNSFLNFMLILFNFRALLHKFYSSVPNCRMRGGKIRCLAKFHDCT